MTPGAGITVSGFAEQFELSPIRRQALGSGTLVLGPAPNTTLENARETSQWLDTFRLH